jgi:dihydroorotate dehydrogenase (fumarate)
MAGTANDTVDLATTYLGLKLRNPLIASASPVTRAVAAIRHLEDAGAAAVVLPSIFEEQIEQEAEERERLTGAGADSFAEALSYFPTVVGFETGSQEYLDLIRRARQAVGIPVIASLNGTTDHGWTDYARLLQEAGASAIELNIYFIPADLSLSGPEVEQRYVAVLRAVKQAVSIPVAVKLSPYFSSMGHFASDLAEAGADGLVLFNRFYQPDIDLVELKLDRALELSRSSEIRLPLLWIALLAGRVRASLAASTGVESADEAVKYLLVGADVVMTTSALLRHGPGHVRTILGGLTAWMESRDIESLGELRGKLSRARTEEPAAFERANYIKILQGWRKAG